VKSFITIGLGNNRVLENGKSDNNKKKNNNIVGLGDPLPVSKLISTF